MAWQHSDLYWWPYYVFHFSYSFSLLLLSIFIYNSLGLYNLNFKYIILPLYVSCRKKCIKLMELSKKLINVWNFILSISVSALALWGHYFFQGFAAHITHDYAWALPLTYQATLLVTGHTYFVFYCCCCFRK